MPRPSSNMLDAMLPGITLNSTKMASTTAATVGIDLQRGGGDEQEHRMQALLATGPHFATGDFSSTHRSSPY